MIRSRLRPHWQNINSGNSDNVLNSRKRQLVWSREVDSTGHDSSLGRYHLSTSAGCHYRSPNQSNGLRF